MTPSGTRTLLEREIGYWRETAEREERVGNFGLAADYRLLADLAEAQFRAVEAQREAAS